MISYAEALHIVCSSAASLPLKTERIPLSESSGRILAENVIADTDLPPFDNSSVDGYAVHYQPGRREWRLIAEARAGHSLVAGLNDESTIAVMTGAALPAGTGAVIPLEDVVVESDQVRLREDAGCSPGMNIRRKGEDLDSASIAVARFSFIKPQTVTLLAACGCHQPAVFKKLRAGILCSGDELVPMNEVPKGDKIRATNPSMLSACTETSHMIPIDLGIAADSREQLRSIIERSVAELDLDLLITTGGVSVGSHDYMKEVLESLGIVTKFWRAKIRPGKPILFGMIQREEKSIPVFGLPGNPVSAFVGFSVFIKPFVHALLHQNADLHFRLPLEKSLVKKDDMRTFLRGTMQDDAASGRRYVAVLPARSSGDMKTLSDANCLVVVPESAHTLSAGTEVECIPI